MKTYNTGSPLAQKKYLEKNLATKPISFFLQIMNVQSDDVRNLWIAGSSYRGDNAFTKLFTKNVLNKGLKQQSGEITK